MTGATGVMGPPVVEAFLALGAEVLAAGPRRTELDALRAAMGQHERLHVAEHDPRDADGTARLFDAWTRQGKADVLVHATPDAGALEERPLEALRVELDAALFGAAVVLGEGLRRMRDDPSGSVVVLCVGSEGARDEGVASPAEAGVLHLVETSARASHGARVNAVLVGRSREEAARAAAWLASDDGQGVHGARVQMR